MHLTLDLGTANYRAGVYGRQDVVSEPSVVAYQKNGNPIVGIEAFRMVGRNPGVVSISQPVQWGAVNDFQGVVDIIRHAAHSWLPKGLGRKFLLTIAVPSGLTQVERKALVEAGKAAGAKEVTLMNAAVAAALGAELPIEAPVGCFVVNLGAGVTEAAILSMQGVVDSRSVNIGGKSIDQGIAEFLKKRHGFLIGALSAEQLKMRCDASTGSENEDIEVKGRSVRTGLPGSLTVSPAILDEQLDSYCTTIVDLIVQTLATCPPELVGDIVERGIVLVGGGAKLNGLVKKLMEQTEVPMIVADEPETCVIRGLLRNRAGHKSRTIWPALFRSAFPGKMESMKQLVAPGKGNKE